MRSPSLSTWFFCQDCTQDSVASYFDNFDDVCLLLGRSPVVDKLSLWNHPPRQSEANEMRLIVFNCVDFFGFVLIVLIAATKMKMMMCVVDKLTC